MSLWVTKCNRIPPPGYDRALYREETEVIVEAASYDDAVEKTQRILRRWKYEASGDTELCAGLMSIKMHDSYQLMAMRE